MRCLKTQNNLIDVEKPPEKEEVRPIYRQENGETDDEKGYFLSIQRYSDKEIGSGTNITNDMHEVGRTDA